MARPSIRDFFRNFDDYDAPWDRKLRKAERRAERKNAPPDDSQPVSEEAKES